MLPADLDLARALGFRLVRLVGAGKVSRVYEARDERDVAVALKVLASDDPDLARRFVREGRIAMRLRHPNLVAALAAVEHDGRAALVLELVRAPSLLARIEAEGPLAEACALQHLEGLGAALQALHGQGVLHRDVKPSNVLVSPERAVLCDLGLARPEDFSTALTGSGALVGSLDYIAPEHVSQQPVGAAADLYSLGATVYHALVGAPPLPAANLVALARRVLYEVPAPVRRARPELTRGLESLVDALLEKDPADRPTAREVVDTAAALRARGG